MCLGENSAPHAVAYLNAQLQALWSIALECVHRHGTYMKPDPSHRAYPLHTWMYWRLIWVLPGYSFALAEWYFGKHRSGGQASAQDMMFHARFEAPRLDFLCNHEALFKINIEEGHFNQDSDGASEESTAERYVPYSALHLASITSFYVRTDLRIELSPLPVHSPSVYLSG